MRSVIDQLTSETSAARSAAVEVYIEVLQRGAAPQPGDAEKLSGAMRVLGWNVARARTDAGTFAAIAEAEADESKVADLAAATQAACVKFGEIDRQLKAEFEAFTARREQALDAAKHAWNEAERVHKLARSSAGRLPALRNQVQAIRTAAISG